MQIRFNASLMLSIPVLIALVITLMPVPSSAFVPEDITTLKETKKCHGCARSLLLPMTVAGPGRSAP